MTRCIKGTSVLKCNIHNDSLYNIIFKLIILTSPPYTTTTKAAMRSSSNPAWLCTSPGPVYLSLDEVGAEDQHDGEQADCKQEGKDEMVHQEEELW